MQKIPTMFERDETVKGHPVKNVLKLECQWVADGLGRASRKIDGMNVKIANGCLYKRRKPTSGDYDEASYVPCERGDPADKYLFEAFDTFQASEFGGVDGIFEAIGPNIQGNPEHQEKNILVQVVPFWPWLELADVPRDFDGLRVYLAAHDIEGIVFHGPGGKLCKIKGRDFGLKR
jgi:hypothetical protein